MQSQGAGAFEPLGAPLGGLGLPESVQQLMDDVSVLRQMTMVDESTGAHSVATGSLHDS